MYATKEQYVHGRKCTVPYMSLQSADTPQRRHPFTGGLCGGRRTSGNLVECWGVDREDMVNSESNYG